MGKESMALTERMRFLQESKAVPPLRYESGEMRDWKMKSGDCPCGEGAGYAGGITSAAMDGIRVAEAIAGKYHT